MGVQGLWTLVTPAARPVQLESLRNRKMAIDASIWIHQFMRTMRDKEGNALRNGHLLGFFRRLCKLLFYNIKPVFVFDGGAPALKRSTIKERRRRREGINNNLKRTAEKILSAQVKTRVLLEEERKRKGEPEKQQEEENYAYFDELEKSAALETIKQKMKRDQYELPALPENQISKIDPRFATQQELIDFINEYRPSKEDIDSEAFMNLPPEIQFEIVRDLGMESRKTSWARLDEMVRQSRTALDFSKQQIKLLVHRNDMTQRILQINERPNTRGAEHQQATRVAGERSREYVLVKNENIDEGLGWKLPGWSSTTNNTTAKTATNENESKKEREKVEKNHEQLSVDDNKELLKKESSGDKVKDAIASNPKLAALLSKFDSDEEEEQEEEKEEQKMTSDTTGTEFRPQHFPEQQGKQMDNSPNYSDDLEYHYIEDDGYDDQPLFLQQKQHQQPYYNEQRRGSLVDDMQAYIEDDEEAVNEVIRRIYANEQEPEKEQGRHKEQPPLSSSKTSSIALQQEEDEMKVDPNRMYQLWLSRVPDAYVYHYSLNDEYKRLLHNAIFDDDVSQLESQLKRVRKLYGKTSDRDSMALDSLAFQERYITHILQWKKRNQPEQNKREITDIVEANQPEGSSREQVVLQSSVEESSNSTKEYSRNTLNTGMKEQRQEQQQSELLPIFTTTTTTTTTADTSLTTNNIVTDASSPTSDDFVMMDEEDEDEIDIPLPDDAIIRNDKSEIGQQLPSPEKTAVQTPPLSPVLISTQHDNLMSGDSNENNKESERMDGGDDNIASRTDDDKHKEMGDRKPTDMEEFKEMDHDNDNEVNTIGNEEIKREIEEEKSIVELEEEHKVAQELAAEQHGYNSDEELVDNATGEYDEYARFVSDISNKDIDSVRQELHQDMKELNKQQRKEMGNTDDITNQMVQDIQELLKLFGIPYVISPMEAEAQCAELARLSLVEGVVTDDSDVFLFGGTRIYKNMFNQQKYVECYMMQDLEREMRLDRDKLIQLAFLLGSDYTEGIPGIGPVAAIEILAEFTQDEDNTIAGPLKRFRDWYHTGKDENEFQRKLRKKHKDLELPEGFPNELVIEAYYHPMVESSQEEFKWGTPQLDTLRVFLMESFTWSEKKADEVLVPVIREMTKRKAEGQQTNIGTYFDSPTGLTTNYAPHKRTQPHKSKRVQSAINRWRGEKDNTDGPKEKKRKKK